jgi:hypothetical protein
MMISNKLPVAKLREIIYNSLIDVRAVIARGQKLRNTRERG